MARLSTTVYRRSSFGASWGAVSGIDVDRLEFALAPGYGRAVLSRDYGFVHETGSGTRGVVAPQTLEGQLLRIDVTDGTNTQYWYGYCPSQADVIDKTTINPDSGAGSVPGGRATYTAYDLGYFLRTATVDSVYTSVSGALTATGRVLPFNGTGRPRYKKVAGNRSGSTTDGVYTFEAGSGNQWTRYQAAGHLLKRFADQYGVTFTLAGQAGSMTGVGVLDFEGRSFWDALRSLINPAAGFTFYLAGTTVMVVSITDTAIGSAVPANPNTATLTLDESQIMSRPAVRTIENAHYDYIEARGGRLRVAFTMRSSWGTLAAGWTAAEETAYKAADDDERRNEANEHVYSRLVLPDDWDGYANSVNCIPVIDTSDGSVDNSEQQNLWLKGAVLERTLPIEDSAGNLRRPVAWIRDDGTGDYWKVDKPPVDLDYAAMNVRVIDDRPGVQMGVRYPHYLALNHFTEDSDYDAILDYEDLIITVSMVTDERVRIRAAAAEAESGPVTKVKIIDVPEAELWWIVAGTVLDVEGTTLSTQAAGASQYARDDRSLLQDVVDLAKAWYGRRRASADVTYTTFDVMPDYLGYVVREIAYGGTVTPAGTIVSRIAYNFTSSTIALRTEWMDLDFALLTGGRTQTATQRRLDDLERQAVNQTVRTAEAAEAGGGEILLYQATTDSYADGDDTVIDAKALDSDGNVTGDTVTFRVIE